MKIFVAILAFIGILLQTFNQVVIVADYYAHKDYIAKNLCENRDKPQMHCDGKCCLKKKLAKDNKEHAPTPRNQKNIQIVNLFCNNTNIVIHPFILSFARKIHFSYNDLTTLAFHHSVFHPPTV